MRTRTAELKDGRVVKYVEVDDPPAGGMKKTYFSPDKSYVVQFFLDKAAGKDPQRMSRLEAILGKYNPTIPESQGGARGVNQATSEYFKKLFCWPAGIVVKPEPGIIAPTYPKNYFFKTGPFANQEKKSKWFTSLKCRSYLPKDEKGLWRNYFSMAILLSRAVRRLHQAGLSHSDLSSNNVLTDPTTGQCVVIDIDSLVVPQLYPPDVVGTPGYIAPEVLSTMHLPLSDPKRHNPSIRTDLHALAVLIYEYLLLRHPLRGPKVHSKNPQEDENLSMGSKALFIEHPKDLSNRPKKLTIPCNTLGKILEDLFYRAFVTGLHSPNDRPAAMEWERGLVKTWDLLFPCDNPTCEYKLFVLNDSSKPFCPFCGRKYAYPSIPFFKLRTERRPGQWIQDGQLAIYHNMYLFNWHAFDNVFPGEESDKTPLAYFAFHQGQWVMVNQHLKSLKSPKGNSVAPGQAIALTNGSVIRLSEEPHGRIAEIQLIKI